MNLPPQYMHIMCKFGLLVVFYLNNATNFFARVISVQILTLSSFSSGPCYHSELESAPISRFSKFKHIYIFIQVGVVLRLSLWLIFFKYECLSHRKGDNNVHIFAVFWVLLGTHKLTTDSSSERILPGNLNVFGLLLHKLGKIHILPSIMQGTSRLVYIINFILSVLFQGFSSLVWHFLLIHKEWLLDCTGMF